MASDTRPEAAPSTGPAVALWRVIGALTQKQAQQLRRELQLLVDATAGESATSRRRGEGVRARHSQSCPSPTGACCCAPRWEAWVYSRKDHAKVRKSFAEYWEAKAWRHEQLEQARNGLVCAPSRRTLADVARVWIVLVQEGRIRNRSGRRYKPSALRTIEQDLRLYLIPALGTRPLAAISRADLQRLIDRCLDEGRSASKARSIVNAARVLWRDFDLITGEEGHVFLDPTRGVRLPSTGGRIERVAGSAEARRLLTALDPTERALWATALYAGLRHGELRALQVRDVDLERRRIQVRRGWDQCEGEIEPKSANATRLALVTEPLQLILAQHLQRTGRSGTDLIFGRTAAMPFDPTTIRKHARAAWAAARRKEDKTETLPTEERIKAIGLQECRHSAVSQMLEAGIPIEKISKLMGHSSITVTIDRYGHLLPEGETEALAQLDAYHRQHKSTRRPTVSER